MLTRYYGNMSKEEEEEQEEDVVAGEFGAEKLREDSKPEHPWPVVRNALMALCPARHSASTALEKKRRHADGMSSQLSDVTSGSRSVLV
ncbi:unnamed protein product [Heligmosomoides polygyrus]|uniref:Uncharacterized protein n=1 Tax=Heligmosomoides polygyrus TaxID=6339 RepID=A0A183FWK9_HELPZ|nr:unnamed protein product [Heligmosomoides polygyrus]